MLVNEMPEQIKGKTFLCKVDNQALKAIIEKKRVYKNAAFK